MLILFGSGAAFTLAFFGHSSQPWTFSLPSSFSSAFFQFLSTSVKLHIPSVGYFCRVTEQCVV